MMFFLPPAINSEAGIILDFFLIFGEIEPRYSYELVVVKTKVCSLKVELEVNCFGIISRLR